jgi:hypothetical protein
MTPIHPTIGELALQENQHGKKGQRILPTIVVICSDNLQFTQGFCYDLGFSGYIILKLAVAAIAIVFQYIIQYI